MQVSSTASEAQKARTRVSSEYERTKKSAGPISFSCVAVKNDRRTCNRCSWPWAPPKRGSDRQQSAGLSVSVSVSGGSLVPRNPHSDYYSTSAFPTIIDACPLPSQQSIRMAPSTRPSTPSMPIKASRHSPAAQSPDAYYHRPSSLQRA